MKLIGIHGTTLLRFGILATPDKQPYLPLVVEALRNEFNFVKSPEITGVETPEMEFFTGEHKDFGIDKLGIYSDGIVLKSKTESGRLDDLMQFMEVWAKKNFGLVFQPSHAVGTVYNSELIIQASDDVFKIFKKVAKLEKSLQDRLQESSKFTAKFSMSGISFDSSQSQLENFKPVSFRFERKVGSAIALGHFYSAAPLPTKSHLDLLEELEGLL